MLAPDSRGADPVGLSRMEIHVHHWREMSTDDLGRTTIRNRGLTISKYHEGCDIIRECSKRSSDGTTLLTREETKRVQEGQVRETVAQGRFWRMRPDGMAVLPPTEKKAGVFCILEFKCGFQMHVGCHGPVSSKSPTKVRISALSDPIHRQGSKVEQISFITGAHSMNEQDLRKNLKFFEVPRLA